MSDNYNGPTQPYNGDDVLVLLKKICLLLLNGAGIGGGAITPVSIGGPVTPQGDQFLVPAGTTNGTVMPNRPAYTSGFTLFMGDGDVVTGYFHELPFTPSGAPGLTNTYGPYDGGLIVNVPEAAGSRNFFVTSITGTPQAIWVQR